MTESAPPNDASVTSRHVFMLVGELAHRFLQSWDFAQVEKQLWRTGWDPSWINGCPSTNFDQARARSKPSSTKF